MTHELVLSDFEDRNVGIQHRFFPILSGIASDAGLPVFQILSTQAVWTPKVHDAFFLGTVIELYIR
jgi:hypothetical protein